MRKTIFRWLRASCESMLGKAFKTMMLTMKAVESRHFAEDAQQNRTEKGEISMIQYIKDCIHYSKRFPFTGGSRKKWLRNVLYVNAQPKYWYGRLITKIL